MQALNTIRNGAQSPVSTPLGILDEQCEHILGRRGIIGGMYSQRPSRARLVADALAHARDLLATRVTELEPGESTAPVADAAKMLAGAALAAADPGNQIHTPGQLVSFVRESPSQVAWWDLPPSRPGGDRHVDDTREWWSRVHDAIRRVGDAERPDSHTLRTLLRLMTEYAYWSKTGVADLP